MHLIERRQHEAHSDKLERFVRRTVRSVLLRGAVAALALIGASVAGARPAAADTVSEYHVDYPAVSCQQGGGLTFWNGSLVNNSGSEQYVACSLIVDDSFTWFNYVQAFSTGTSNGVSCWIGLISRSQSGTAHNPNSRDYPSGYEVQTWNTWFYPQQSILDLECAIAPGASLTGYTIGARWRNWLG